MAGVKIGKGIVVPPCPPPDIDIEAWVESINLLRSLKLSAIYLTHFVLITDIDEHLDSLENRLWDWAKWIKPYLGTEMKEVVPKFEAYVVQQLKENGLDSEGLDQYEKANPAWMSVAGLMRYWKKKLEKKS